MAIEHNPDYYEAHLALGTIMARAGNMTEARQHFQKAAESGNPALRQNALKALR
jgi:Tfp pilus assembly protein PilF